jgi:hypothetical protein
MLNRNSTALLGALLGASLMFVASPATSQSFYGSLVSVVRDAQGKVIPASRIVLTNTATSERREGVSAKTGEYRFVNLVPGTYRLEVELSGFQRYVRDRIEVNVQSQPRIEVALQLGSLAETIEVSGASPLLQTENASLGIVVSSRPVQELPLNGRNVLNLISLAPAVVPQGGTEGSLTGKNAARRRRPDRRLHVAVSRPRVREGVARGTLANARRSSGDDRGRRRKAAAPEVHDDGDDVHRAHPDHVGHRDRVRRVEADRCADGWRHLHIVRPGARRLRGDLRDVEVALRDEALRRRTAAGRVPRPAIAQGGAVTLIDNSSRAPASFILGPTGYLAVSCCVWTT